MLLVLPAGGVVGEDPALLGRHVPAREQRHHHQALQGETQVEPDHRGQPVGLPHQRQRLALDLLVVLELDLEQPDQLDRDPGGPGDADDRELIGREHLLDVALGDDVAHRGPPVAGHDHTAGEGRGDDRRAVRGEVADAGRRRSRVTAAVGRDPSREIGERRGTRREELRAQLTGPDPVDHCPPFCTNDRTNSSALTSSTSSISSSNESTSESSSALCALSAGARSSTSRSSTRRGLLLLCSRLRHETLLVDRRASRLTNTADRTSRHRYRGAYGGLVRRTRDRAAAARSRRRQRYADRGLAGPRQALRLGAPAAPGGPRGARRRGPDRGHPGRLRARSGGEGGVDRDEPEVYFTTPHFDGYPRCWSGWSGSAYRNSRSCWSRPGWPGRRSGWPPSTATPSPPHMLPAPVYRGRERDVGRQRVGRGVSGRGRRTGR